MMATDQAKAMLQQAGLRRTAPRVMVLRILAERPHSGASAPICHRRARAEAPEADLVPSEATAKNRPREEHA